MKKHSPLKLGGLALVGYVALVLGSTLIMNKAHGKDWDDAYENSAIAYTEICERHCTFMNAEEAKANRQHLQEDSLQSKEISRAKVHFYKQVKTGIFHDTMNAKHDFYIQTIQKLAVKQNNNDANDYVEWLSGLNDNEFMAVVAEVCNGGAMNCSTDFYLAVAAYRVDPEGIGANTERFLKDLAMLDSHDNQMMINLIQDFRINEIVMEDINEAVYARDYLFYQAK